MPSTELVYDNGRYYRAPAEPQPKRRGHQSVGVWRTTYELWDEVLYGIGSAYEKLRGR